MAHLNKKTYIFYSSISVKFLPLFFDNVQNKIFIAEVLPV